MLETLTEEPPSLLSNLSILERGGDHGGERKGPNEPWRCCLQTEMINQKIFTMKPTKEISPLFQL